MSKMEGLSIKKTTEGIKKITQIAVLTAAGLTTGISKGEAQSPFSSSGLKNETEIIKDTKNIETKEVNPEDYDLKKIGKLDMRDLNEKKSLDSEAIKRIMTEAIQRSKISDMINSSLMSLGQVDHSIRSITRHIENAQKEGNEELKELEQTLVEKKKEREEIVKKMKEIFEIDDKIRRNQFDAVQISISEVDKVRLKFDSSKINEIESARTEAIRLVSGSSYVDKLQKEFNCSREKAIEHQKVRLSNLDIINYILLSKEEIQSNGNKGVLGYATLGSNVITLPYDDNSSGFQMFEIALHEFLHLATNGNNGLSNEAKSLLSNKSLKENFGEKILDKKDYDYVFDPTERYVRFKILESDLEKHNIKKIGELFTMDHFKKMMKLWESGILYHGSSDFIKNTKEMKENGVYKKMMDFYGVSNDKLIKNDEEGYIIFKELFDKIASIDNLNKKVDDNYIYPGWDYSNPTNRA